MRTALITAVAVSLGFAGGVETSGQQPQQLYEQAQAAYQQGRGLEATSPHGALARYGEALRYLSAPIPPASGSLLGEMAADGLNKEVLVTPEGSPSDSSRMRDEYPTAATLASSIALDEVRLRRLYRDDPSQSLELAKDTSLAILLTRSDTNQEPKLGCVGSLPHGLAYMEKFPDHWREPPLPMHEAAAYFNMGMVQLFQGEPSKAEICFQQVLRIDPTNEAAKSYKAAFADARDDEKDRLKLGSTIALNILSENAAVTTITQAILNYFIDRMPDAFRY